MLIKGVDVTLDPWRDDEREQMHNALLERVVEVFRLTGNTSPDPAVLGRVISIVQDSLFTELGNAAAYVWLRTEMTKTMPDPDCWDGDEPEECVLARYVQHQALASHGDCDRCGRKILAGEMFDAVGNVGNSVPMGSSETAAVLCGSCV